MGRFWAKPGAEGFAPKSRPFDTTGYTRKSLWAAPDFLGRLLGFWAKPIGGAFNAYPYGFAQMCLRRSGFAVTPFLFALAGGSGASSQE